jgi:hypothetical protein
MANTSRINGFRPVFHLGGAKIQARKYVIVAADGTAVYPGDVVKYSGTADADGTYASVALAAAGDPILGVVGEFEPNRDNLNVAGQYRAASTLRYVYVFDDPMIVYEVEASNGTPAITDVGLNANHATGTPNSTTATSGAYIDFGTEATTAALSFKILGFASRVDNEVGASAKLLVKINNHQHGSHTGTAGV